MIRHNYISIINNNKRSSVNNTILIYYYNKSNISNSIKKSIKKQNILGTYVKSLPTYYVNR